LQWDFTIGRWKYSEKLDAEDEDLKSNALLSAKSAKGKKCRFFGRRKTPAN
jgi:hypothetical protein